MTSRRDFLMMAGGGLATGIVAPTISGIGTEVWGHLRKGAETALDRFDYDIDVIKGLFGPIDARASFIPGQSHPKYEGFHPDDEYVADVFDDLVKDAVENRVVYDVEDLPQNLRGVALVSGSPVSNALSRYLLQYDYLDEAEPLEGLLRTEDPVFETKYEFLLAKTALHELGISEPVGRTGTSGNWSVVDKKSGEVFAAETKDGRINSDFLMVTCLPNIFHKESYKNDECIYLLAGGHGVGTKAVDLLLRDSSLMSRLKERVGRSKYWQCLFQVEGVDHFHEDPKFGVRWHPSKLSSDFEFSTVSFNEARLSELATWA